MIMVSKVLATTTRWVAFCIAMGCIGTIAGWWSAQRPPLIVTDLHEADGVAVRGDWLELDVSLTRMRLCDAHVDRWLWRDDAGLRTWVPLPRVASPPTVLNVPTRYRVWLPVPGNIPAGRWHYLSRTWDECASPWTLIPPTVRESRDVPVLILDPPDDAPAQIIVAPGPVTVLPAPTRRP